jgi:Uri superfamily endonuclease
MPLTDLPSQPGVYLLLLTLGRAQTLTIGRLGTFDFAAGEYVYAGSAAGPGGLAARLGRHLRGSAARRWHIDYLRAAAAVRGAIYLARPTGAALVGLECAWNAIVQEQPGTNLPVVGFGASDCRRGCRAHLTAAPPGTLDATALLAALPTAPPGDTPRAGDRPQWRAA